MGLLVIVTGILSLQPQNAATKTKDPDCSPSPMVYATIILGVAMLCAGTLFLAKLKTKGTVSGGDTESMEDVTPADTGAGET